MPACAEKNTSARIERMHPLGQQRWVRGVPRLRRRPALARFSEPASYPQWEGGPCPVSAILLLAIVSSVLARPAPRCTRHLTRLSPASFFLRCTAS